MNHNQYINILKKLCVVSFTCFSLINGYAGERTETIILDIESAVELARSRAHIILAAGAAVAASKADESTELAFSHPQLNLNSSYSHNGKLVTFPFGPFGEIAAGRKNDYRNTLELKQLLWSFGKRAKVKEKVSANTDAALADLAISARDISFQIRIAFASYLLKRETTQINSQRQSQRTQELEDAIALKEAGKVTALDVRQSQINLINSSNNLTQSEADLQLAKFDIAAILSMESTDFKIDADLTRPGEIKTLISKARENLELSPDIHELKSKIAALSAESKEIVGESLPDIHAVATANNEGGKIDNLTDAWSVGLTLSWNIFDGGNRHGRKSSIAMQQIELEHLIKEIIMNRSRDIKKIIVELNTFSTNIEQLQHSVDLARENYQDAGDQYRSGLITLTRLGEIGLDAKTARFNLAQMIHDELIASFQLMFLIE